MKFTPRSPLPEADAAAVSEALQAVLVTLIDLSLVAKQAHWNVFGQQFLSVHEKLDELVLTARDGLDVVAERMVQLGTAPDGRAGTVAETTPLKAYPKSFQSVPESLRKVSDRLLTVAESMRAGIAVAGEHDPLTEDQLIAIAQPIEEHLWMFQAMAADA